MNVTLNITKKELEKLKKAVGLPENIENADEEDVVDAIHLLIEVYI